MIATGIWRITIFSAVMWSATAERIIPGRGGIWITAPGVPLSDSLKSFNPICRCSNSALHILDQYQKAGYFAHEELIMATCFYTHGMKIGDLGGDGAFVPEGYMNKFYLDAPNEINGGTMRYRPVYSQEEVQNFCLANTLFHPIKSERDNQ